MKVKVISLVVASNRDRKRGILIPEKNNLFIYVNADVVHIYNINPQYSGQILGEIEISDDLYNKLITLHELKTELGKVGGEFSEFFKTTMESIPEPNF
jgi:hypothetical protein